MDGWPGGGLEWNTKRGGRFRVSEEEVEESWSQNPDEERRKLKWAIPQALQLVFPSGSRVNKRPSGGNRVTLLRQHNQRVRNGFLMKKLIFPTFGRPITGVCGRDPLGQRQRRQWEKLWPKVNNDEERRRRMFVSCRDGRRVTSSALLGQGPLMNRRLSEWMSIRLSAGERPAMSGCPFPRLPERNRFSIGVHL